MAENTILNLQSQKPLTFQAKPSQTHQRTSIGTQNLNKSQIIRPISIKISIRHTVREKVSFLQKLQNME